MSRAMRTILGRVACLMLAGWLALACGGQGPAAADSGETVVQVWQGFNTEETAVFRQIMRDFEREWSARNGRPLRVVVHYVAYNDMFTKLRTAALARLTPDVAFMDSIKVTDLAFGRALTPLDELPGFRARYGTLAQAREQFVQASFESGVVNRKGETHLYGLPVQTTTVALFWNKALFRDRAGELRAAGLDPNRAPRDWDELIAYGRVLTQPERGIWAYGMSGSLWFNFPIFNMYGMEMVRYDATGRASAALDTPAGLAALERMRAIAASGVEGGAWKRSALFPDAGFINRKYAMILTGPWMVENFTNAGLDFDVALIPGPTAAEAAALGLAPRAPGRVAELGPLAWSSSNVGGQTGVVLKTCARPEVAFELLDYFTSEAVQRRWASGLGQIPVRLAAWRDLDTRKYPFMPKFMEQLALAQRTPQIPLYGRLENDIFNPEVDLLLQRPGYPARTMLQNMERGMREKILEPINEGIDAAGRAPLERQGS